MPFKSLQSNKGNVGEGGGGREGGREGEGRRLESEGEKNTDIPFNFHIVDLGVFEREKSVVTKLQ